MNLGRLFTYMVKAAAGQQPAPFTEGEYQAWLRDGARFDSTYYHPAMERRIFEDEKKYARAIDYSSGQTVLSMMPTFPGLVENVRQQQKDRGTAHINKILSQGGALPTWMQEHLQLGYGITPKLLQDAKFLARLGQVDANDQRAVENVFRASDINWNRRTSDYRNPEFIRSLQAGIKAGKWKPAAPAEAPSEPAPAPTPAPPQPAPKPAPVQAPAIPQPAPAAPQAPTATPGGTFNSPAFVSSPMQVSFYNLPAGMSQQAAMQNWNSIGSRRVQRYLEATGRQGAKNIQVSPDGSTIRFIHSNGGSTETDTSLSQRDPSRLVQKVTPPSTLRQKVTPPSTLRQKVTPPSTLRRTTKPPMSVRP